MKGTWTLESLTPQKIICLESSYSADQNSYPLKLGYMEGRMQGQSEGESKETRCDIP